MNSIENFIIRNHKPETVTMVETIGHNQFALFAAQNVKISIGERTFDLKPWRVAFVNLTNEETTIKNLAKECTRKWRVKESGEFARINIEGGAVII